MAMTDENGMVMPVSPMGGFGNGYNDGGSWWILLLFILLGGWGNGFGGYGNGGAGFVDNSVQRGFDQSAIMTGLTGINSNMVSGFANAETANNARQIADMQQDFALQSQLASCCCENRLASADLKYTIATEACADRNAVTSALQDIIANQTANTQRILDTLCNDKIDAKNEQIMALERQLAMSNLAASQTAQTAEILARLPVTATTTGA